MEDNKNIPAPTAQVLADDKSFTVTDSTGRKLTYKALGLMEKSRLMRAIGAEHATNQIFFGHAAIAAGVREIDGEPVPWPGNLKQVDQALDRLEDHGLEAVVTEIAARMPEGEGDLFEDAKN